MAQQHDADADFRLGPDRRIKSRRDFLRIQQVGKKFRAKHFLLIYLPAEDGATESRIGPTITKKVDKRAVKRNYLKRRIKEFFRLNRQRLLAKTDIVIVALTGAATLSTDEIFNELEFLFGRAGLVARKPDRSSKQQVVKE